MNKFKNFPQLFYLGFYHPRYDYFENIREDNCYFNEFSNNILELKKRNRIAINYFRDILLKLMEDEEVTITTVPPHITRESSGIRDLAGCLIESNKKYIDAIHCLERFKTVPASSPISRKDEQTHLSSIRLESVSLIKDKTVFLFDDIMTTGNSVNACKKILSSLGAKEVKIICLGKTIRRVSEAHDLVDEMLEQELQELSVQYSLEIQEIEQYFEFQMNSLDREGDDYDQLLEDIYEIESLKRQNADNISNSICCTENHLEECAVEAHRALSGEDYLTPDNPFVSVFKDLQ